MSIDPSRLLAAHAAARQALLAERDPSGHWTGRLASSALSTATAVSALAIAARHARTNESGCFADEPAEARLNELIVRGLHYLTETQNADGGWGDTDLSRSNIATTMLVKAAFSLTGLPANDEDLLGRADAYLAGQGGIPALRRRYGKDKTFAVPILTNCALAGFVPWREVTALPFELACVPQHWFRFLRLPVVSYAIPALVAIGQVKFYFSPPWNPVLRWVRRAALAKSLRVLEQMQPESGGFLEATPLTSFVVMSMAATRHAEHPVVRRGVEFLIASAREDGSWPIDTNLATWNTTLAVNALATPSLDVGRSASGSSRSAEHRTSNIERPTSNGPAVAPVKEARLLQEAGLLKIGDASQLLDWLLGCQLRQRHPYTGAAAGGWAWTDLSGGVPDADDTSGALLTLRHLPSSGRDEQRVVAAAAAGVNWLLDLQNSNGGWPTFCRGWGTMPFDRSATDLTAHAIRALHAWRDTLAKQSGSPAAVGQTTAPPVATRINEAIHRGFGFLRQSQHAGGNWTPLWFGNQHHPREENPVYGTARVLLAYRDLGRLDTPEARRGLQWLAVHQNLDGGWGGAALGACAGESHAGDARTSAAMNGLSDSGELRRTGQSEPLGAAGGSDSSLRLHRPRHGSRQMRMSAHGPVTAGTGRANTLGVPHAGEEGIPGRVIDHPQSTVEETALAVEALCSAPLDASFVKACDDGLAWLVEAVERKHFSQCSPIGLYFAKLWYYEKLYPLIFTVSALGNAAGHAARRMARQPGETASHVAPALTRSLPVSLSR